mmetsp:Transcript_11818/g.15419  ORF Transcript_11818/g.15419 Transcript_11818/m.15419 type:complete len:360 (-) Transcript_11818:138-1217(-)
MFQHDTIDPLSNIGHYLLSNCKSKLGRRLTRHKPIAQKVMIQIFTNKHKPAFTLFLRHCPLPFKVTTEHHAHSLEHKLIVHTLDSKHTLVPVQIGTILSNETLNPTFEHTQITVPLHLHTHRSHSLIMLMLLLIIQKLRIKFKHTLQLKRLNIQHLLGTNLTVLRLYNGSCRINLLNLLLNLHLHLLVHQIHLIQQNLVGKRHLLHRLILSPLRLLLRHTLQNILGIHHRNHTIQLIMRLHRLIHKERLHDRCRIRQSRRLNDHTVKLLNFGVQRFQSLDQISTYGTADASVHDFDHFLVDIFGDDFVVHADITEFVFDNGEFHPVCVVVEDVIHEGGFTGAEEAGEDGDGYFLAGHFR